MLLTLARKDPKVLARYGENDPSYQRDGAPKMIQNFCIARRLVKLVPVLSRSTIVVGLAWR